MATLAGIVKDLLLIVVVATFLELMLPDSSLRSFVRFAVGLFVIMAIINPFLTVLYSGQNLQSLAWDLPWEYEPGSQAEKAGLELNQDLQQAGQQALSKKVGDQINSMAMLVPGVEDLQTEVMVDEEKGRVSEIEMVVVCGPSTESADGSVEVFSAKEEINNREAIKKKLTGIMKNIYGIDDSAVKIRFEGG